MVVEDCETDIDALVACLGERYRVRVSLDGASALESIRQDVPDMVLLDILMPGIDGFEVCRQIKEDPMLRDVLVIFVTCLTETVDETRGLEMGAVDYITKPFNFAVIRAKIKTHLELAKVRNELAHQNEILKENIRLREQVELVYRHDLKTPIQLVLGAAQLLKSPGKIEMDRARQEKLLQDQINACFTMVDMLNRTMMLYKMERGICPLNVTQVNIMPIFDRIFMGNSKKMSTKNIESRTVINHRPADPDQAYILWCDEMLFYTMMNNLIANAVDASPNDGCIDIRIYDGEPDRIKIEIENQGLIPEPVRNRFFEKFATYGKTNGTGIGTYSAMLTAKLHGGSIDFSISEKTNTTVLRVYLPRRE